MEYLAFVSPLITKDSIIVPGNQHYHDGGLSYIFGGIYCYDLEGKLKWEHKHKVNDNYSWNPVSTLDDLLIIGSAEGVYALDKKNGKVKWETKVRKRKNYVTTPCVIDDDIILFGMNKKLFAINKKGKYLWEYNSGPSTRHVRFSIALSGDLVFFGSRDTGVHCLDRYNGKKRWRFSDCANILSELAVLRHKND